MIGVTIRVASANDAAAIARVHLTSWRATYGELLPESHWDTDTLALRTERWERKLVDEDHGQDPVFVAQHHEVVGFALGGPGREKGAMPPPCDRELYALYVDATHHGAGVAKELLGRAVTHEDAAFLWVAAANPRAIRFYEKNGFTLDGAQHAGTYGIREIRMVRGAGQAPKVHRAALT